MIKIKWIKFYNHPIFINQTFSFLLNDGSVANSVVFAGENGVGKTRLLEEIKGIESSHFFTSAHLYPNKKYEVLLDITDEGYYIDKDKSKKIKEIKLIFSTGINGIEGKKAEFQFGDEFKHKTYKDNGDEEIQEFKIRCMYSSVDINYIPQREVQGITNKALDSDNDSRVFDVAQETIQLLVDIVAQDSADLDSWVAEHQGQVPPENVQRTRFKRFLNAFKGMFGDTILYKRMDKNTRPIFQKCGDEIDITSLSSGEKQIVFRGVNLLKNKYSMMGMPALVDEPELSMHPKWEDKIFDYYRNLFIENQNQTSQLFMATHSEHILEKVLSMNDSLVIKMANGTYQKYYRGSIGEILPTISIAEIKYSIFDMYTIDFHIMLYGYIQENIIAVEIGHNPNIFETDNWLRSKNVTSKMYTYTNRAYNTLQTYIRNCIDHPDSAHTYTDSEFKKSIDEMINIIKNNP